MTDASRAPVQGATSIDTSVIVPVFNGADVVPQLCEALAEWLPTLPWSAEVIVVDDGSTDATPSMMERSRAVAGLRLCRHASNRGKGAAVRTGMQAAAGRNRIFVDADLAYSLDQVTRVREQLVAGADVAIAARTHPGSKLLVDSGAVSEFVRRRKAGRMFNCFVQWLVLPGFADTQAGLKGFSAPAAEAIFARTTLDRFAFDVEILMIARQLGLRIAEVPVIVRCRGQDSSVRLRFDSLQMLKDLLRIRSNARRGAYARSATGQRPA